MQMLTRSALAILGLALIWSGIAVEPAQAQLGCLIQTQSQLLSQFSDTAAPSSIAPAAVRNIICSIPTLAAGSQVSGPGTSRNGATVIFNGTGGNNIAQSAGYLPNVIDDCGAAGNGTTADDAAFATCDALFKEYDVPATASGYRISSATGWIIPSGIVAHGLGFNPGNPFAGAFIVCDLTVTPCVQTTTGSNGQIGLDHITVSRAAGSIPATSIGVLVYETYNSRIHDVFSYRHGEGFYLQMSGAAGISTFMDEDFTGAISDAHVVVDGMPEVHIVNSRFGMAGAGDVNGTTYLRFTGPSSGVYVSGSGPNGLFLDNDQFNLGTSSVQYWLQFTNLVSPVLQTGFNSITNTYVESVSTGFIFTDASWTALRFFNINNLHLNESTPVFALNAATALDQFHIDNSSMLGPFTLAPSTTIGDINVANSYIGAVTLSPGTSGGDANFSNNTIGSLTLSGNWGAVDFIGGVSLGAINSTATGNITVLIPGSPPFFSTLAASSQVCTNSNGQLTTTGCSGGGGGVNPGTVGQIGYYATTGSTLSGSAGFLLGSSAPQLLLDSPVPGSGLTFEILNNATGTGTAANLLITTATANGYVNIGAASGATPAGSITFGAGMSGGGVVTTLTGPITLNPATSILVPTLAASSAVCTDGSKNLTTTGCATAGGITSVTGTSGEITAVTTSGAVVLSLPGTITSNETLSGAITFSGSITGAALSNYLASPPSIGGTSPGAAEFTSLTATGNLTTDITGGGTQCVQASNIGVLSGTGASCGGGGGGVSPGTAGNVAYYASTGSTVGPVAGLNISGSSPQFTLGVSAAAGAVQMEVLNNTSANNSLSGFLAATGVSQAYVTMYENNESVSPLAFIEAGSANGSLVMQADGGAIILNAASGNSVNLRINSSNVIQAFTGSSGLIFSGYTGGGAGCTALTTTSAGTLQCTVSAKRYKTPIGSITPQEGIDGIDDLHPAVWTPRGVSIYETAGPVGLYANDVAKMDNRCVIYDSDGEVKNYWDRCVLAYLVAANQELKREIDAIMGDRK